MQRYRILYACGPGDVIQGYRDWKTGQATISETSLTFSGQTFDFCRANQLELWAISSHPRSELIDDGQFRIENRPMRPSGKVRGWQYHVRQLRYALSLLLSASRYKADLVIVNSGTIHFFPLALFSLMGMKVVTNLHSVYWPVGYPPKSRIRKLVMQLDGWFFSHFADASMGVSPECERQVSMLAGRPVPFFQHRAQFRESDFHALKAPDYGLRPFRVMFAGRIERNKGVFDLIDIATKLWQRRPHQVVFDVCGGGSAFDELREEVEKHGLGDIVKLHGKLIRPELLRIYEQSHLVIIPTRSDFCEGMPMVSAEAVLAGRPVLSSRVSNALDVLDEAIIEARTEDIEDYAVKIEHLLDHQGSYEKCAAACSIASRQFIDRSRGKTAALGRMLEALRPGWKAAPSAAERAGFDAEPSRTATSL